MSGQVNQKAIFLQGSWLQVPVLTYLIIHCNLKCKPNKLFPLQVAYGYGADHKKITLDQYFLTLEIKHWCFTDKHERWYYQQIYTNWYSNAKIKEATKWYQRVHVRYCKVCDKLRKLSIKQKQTKWNDKTKIILLGKTWSL